MNIKQMLYAFRYQNFRLFFVGQSVSLIGTWMQMIAMAWLVYRLTNSPFLLGIVGFASQLPTFILTPFAGVIADRRDRFKILFITQILAMLQALILACFVMVGITPIWLIIALSLWLGVINAFDMPTRQAFVVDIMEKKSELSNAIALNSAMVNIARLLGPMLAGFLIALYGEGICFAINGISYLAAIAAMLMMRLRPQKITPTGKSILGELREGLGYVRHSIPIRDLLLTLTAISLPSMTYIVLMPVFAKEILRGGPQTMGLLMAASGIGALGGGLFLAARKNVLGLARLIPLAAALFGLSLVGFSFSRDFWSALVMIALAGFGMMVQMASSNTLLQTIVHDEKRGRVMSLFTMAFVGMAPFGSLLAGGLAHLIGTPHTILFSGLFILLISFGFWLRLPVFHQHVHPIYVKMGIVP